MTQLFPRIRRVAAAITISARMIAVLAAAWHFAERLNARLFVIHGGVPDARKEAQFRDAMVQLEMPGETRIVWSEGEPAGAIVTAAEKEGVDLLIAGAHARRGRTVAARFCATAPACAVPVESKIVDTTTGFGACDFTQSIGGELLVVPKPEHLEVAVPSMMDWALQVIPCSLWIAGVRGAVAGALAP